MSIKINEPFYDKILEFLGKKLEQWILKLMLRLHYEILDNADSIVEDYFVW